MAHLDQIVNGLLFVSALIYTVVLYTVCAADRQQQSLLALLEKHQCSNTMKKC